MSMRIAVLTQRGISINVNDGTAGIALSNRITIPYDRCSLDRALNGIDSIYYKINSEEAIKYMMYLDSNGIKAEPCLQLCEYGGKGNVKSYEAQSARLENVDDEYVINSNCWYRNDSYYTWLRDQIDRTAKLGHTLRGLGHVIQKYKAENGAEILDMFDIGTKEYDLRLSGIVYCKDRHRVDIAEAKRIANEAFKRGLAFTSLTNALMADSAVIMVGFACVYSQDKKEAAALAEHSITEVLDDKIKTIGIDTGTR